MTEESDARIIVRETDNRGLKEFVDLPFRLYKKDRNWVPPLKNDVRGMLEGNDNELFKQGPHTLLLAYRQGGKKPVARLLCGMNPKYRDIPGEVWGYFSLFDAEDEHSGSAILEYAAKWCGQHGATHIAGPLSPDNGEGDRGVLVTGFDGPPYLMNSYNPQWYPEFFESCGFCKYLDNYALKLDVDRLEIEKLKKLAAYSFEHFGFHVDTVNLNNLREEVDDFYEVLVKSVENMPGFPVPSFEFVQGFVRSMKDIADADIIGIARRDSDNAPLGFVVAIPNYNEVLIKLRGRLLPFGFIKFLYYRNKIKSVRVMQQFCIPEYRSKGVIPAIYLKLIENSIQKGYKQAEASTIGEENLRSWKSVASIGGKVYRVYRYYYKEIPKTYGI